MWLVISTENFLGNTCINAPRVTKFMRQSFIMILKVIQFVSIDNELMSFLLAGLLGVLTSVFLVYLGVQFGRILKTYTDVKSKMIRWITWGVLTVSCICEIVDFFDNAILLQALLGGILCKFSKNDGFIPVNKNLWSLSFVLVLGGLAFLIQACLFITVDITRKWGGRPCFYPGMNSLAIYVGSEVFKGIFPFGWIPAVKTHGAYLGMNLWGTALWVAIAIFLYKRNIFLTL